MQRDYDANNSNSVQLGCSRHADAAASGCQIQRQWERTFDPDTQYSLAGGRSSLLSGSTSCGVLTAAGRGSAVHRLVTPSVSCFDALGTDMVITAGPRLA